MKFEDALTQMREGKKIRHASFEDDVYFMACRVGIPFDDTPQDQWPISITKMKGEFEHEDMGRGSTNDFIPGTMIFTEEAKERIFKPCKHGHAPQLNLLLIISDEWEVIE